MDKFDKECVDFGRKVKAIYMKKSMHYVGSMGYLKSPNSKNPSEAFTLVVELTLQQDKAARTALAEKIEKANGGIPTETSIILESKDAELRGRAVKYLKDMRESLTGDTKRDVLEFLRRNYPEEMEVARSKITHEVGSVTSVELALRKGDEGSDERMGLAKKIEDKNKGIPTPISIALGSEDFILRNIVADDLQAKRKDEAVGALLKEVVSLMRHSHSV